MHTETYTQIQPWPPDLTLKSWSDQESWNVYVKLCITDVWICVFTCMYVCLYSFFFFIVHSSCYKRGGFREKGAILPLWGIDCKFWLFNLWGCLWRFTATSILFPCAAIFPLWDKHHPQQPLLPTPLLLCGCAAGCTTPGLLGPAQQPPQVGFLSTSSLLSTYTHSIVCDLTEQKV